MKEFRRLLKNKGMLKEEEIVCEDLQQFLGKFRKIKPGQEDHKYTTQRDRNDPNYISNNYGSVINPVVTTETKEPIVPISILKSFEKSTTRVQPVKRDFDRFLEINNTGSNLSKESSDQYTTNGIQPKQSSSSLSPTKTDLEKRKEELKMREAQKLGLGQVSAEKDKDKDKNKEIIKKKMDYLRNNMKGTGTNATPDQGTKPSENK